MPAFLKAYDAGTSVARWLTVIAFLDFLGVATVVPLLSSYLAEAGCCSETMAFVSSAYSVAQIVGGIILGYASDCLLSRRSVLLISLTGSAVSYGMLAFSTSRGVVIFSRMIAGLVKQTITMSQAIISDLPLERRQRTEQLSTLNAAITGSWILGPALGGFLFSLSPAFPPVCAALLFAVAAILCAATQPRHRLAAQIKSQKATAEKGSITGLAAVRRFRRNLAEVFADPTTACIIILRLLYSFLLVSLIPIDFLAYLKARYSLQGQTSAYLHSYRAALAFLAQTFLINRLVKSRHFDEAETARFALIAGLAVKGLDALNYSAAVFLGVVTPLSIAVFSVFDSAMQGLYTDALPPDYRGALLGSINALHSFIRVIGPIYSTLLYHRFELRRRPEITFVHYTVYTVIVWLVLSPSRQRRCRPRRLSEGRMEQNGSCGISQEASKESVGPGRTALSNGVRHRGGREFERLKAQ